MDKKRKALFFVTLFSLFWAIDILLAKILLTKGVAPLKISYQSLLGAALITFIYILTKEPKKLTSISKNHLGILVLIGIIGNGLAVISSIYGLQLSTAINYGFLIKMTLVFTVFLAYFFLNESLNAKKLGYVLLLVAGAYLITTKGETVYPRLGDLLIILAAFFLTVANIIAKGIIKNHSAGIIALFRSFFGGLFVLLVSTLLVPSFHVLEEPLLILSLSIAAFLTLLFINKTFEVASTSYVAMMSMMFSIFVAIGGIFFLQESITFIQITGAMIITISVFLSYRLKI